MCQHREQQHESSGPVLFCAMSIVIAAVAFFVTCMVAGDLASEVVAMRRQAASANALTVDAKSTALHAQAEIAKLKKQLAGLDAMKDLVDEHEHALAGHDAKLFEDRKDINYLDSRFTDGRAYVEREATKIESNLDDLSTAAKAESANRHQNSNAIRGCEAWIKYLDKKTQGKR
jgi:chromosome segregation ATPase